MKTLDVVFPTDNEYGIPLLNIHKQAIAPVLPITQWGTVGRNVRMYGTYAFYVDDYRFEALWKNPAKLLQTGCVCIVETNMSIYDDMPLAQVLWLTYQKRWLSRYWQEYGNIHILADLNVSAKYRNANTYGIPVGWRSFSTRAYKARYTQLHEEYAHAVSIAQTNDILFLVYGGGKGARDICYTNGWLWVEDQRTEVDTRNG